MSSNAKTAQVQIIGSIPCAVCNEPMTQKDVAADQVIFMKGRSTTGAHLKHFYTNVTGDWRPVADYNANMQRLVQTHGINEGWHVRGEG